MWKILLRNLICHRKKNVMMLSAVIFSAVLLNAYQGNIVSDEEQLRKLADITPIYCYITNLNGSQKAGLDINERMVSQLMESEYTKDVAYTIKVNGGIGNIPEDEWYRLGYNVIALNSIGALPDLGYEDILPDGEEEAFFQSEEDIAIFSSEFMEENHLKVGDEVPFTLYRYQYDHLDIYCHPFAMVTLKIVGEMANRVPGPEGHVLDVLLPAKYVERMFEEKGIRVFMDSVSFYLKDPLEINAAKEEFKRMYLLGRVSDAMPSYIGLALNMKDASFISLAGNLKRNIVLLKIFLFPLCFLLFSIGVLISFILMRNWKKEYATMRLLGVYESQCMLIYCFESLFLTVIGILAGNGITHFMQKGNSGWSCGFLMAAAFVAGTCMAALFAEKEIRSGDAWRS